MITLIIAVQFLNVMMFITDWISLIHQVHKNGNPLKYGIVRYNQVMINQMELYQLKL